MAGVNDIVSPFMIESFFAKVTLAERDYSNACNCARLDGSLVFLPAALRLVCYEQRHERRHEWMEQVW